MKPMNLSHQTILVTGGAGFIGGHVVERIFRNNRVIVYDNFSSPVFVPPCKIIRGDVQNTKTLIKAMKGVDIVFHFAVACVRLSLSDEQYVHSVNATGTLSSLIAAKKAGVKRFIYISSSEVYGSSLSGKMRENHPINPTSIYGMSKYIGELYTKHFNDHHGLPAIIVRPFNTYGPRSHFDGVYGEVIPRFAIRALNGKQPLIFGSGKQTRDFTDVSDTATGIIQAAQSDALIGTCINIARGQEVTILDIAHHICREIELPFKPIMKSPRPHDVMRHYADSTKAKKILSFKPKITIAQGISSYISWIQKTYPDPKKLLNKIPDKNW